MKKLITALVMILVLGASLTACSSRSSAETPRPAVLPKWLLAI